MKTTGLFATPHSRRRPGQPGPAERDEADRGGASPLFWLGLPAMVGGHLALMAASQVAGAGGAATVERSPAAEPDAEETDPTVDVPVRAAAAEPAAPSGEVERAEVGAVGELAPDPRGAVDGEPAPAAATAGEDAGAPFPEPAPDGGKAGEGRAGRGRARRRTRPADGEATGEGVEQVVGLGPLVRQVAGLTKELGEAQQAIGRLAAERDALRRQLLDLNVAPIAGDDDLLPVAREIRVGVREARAARQAERDAGRIGVVPVEEIDPELANRARDVGRRRRMIALGVLGALLLTIVVLRSIGVGISTDDLSRDGLTGLAFIGPIFNILIGLFLIYRVVKFGGKGARWLFPEPEQPRKRRR